MEEIKELLLSENADDQLLGVILAMKTLSEEQLRKLFSKFSIYTDTWKLRTAKYNKNLVVKGDLACHFTIYPSLMPFSENNRQFVYIDLTDEERDI